MRPLVHRFIKDTTGIPKLTNCIVLILVYCYKNPLSPLTWEIEDFLYLITEFEL